MFVVYRQCIHDFTLIVDNTYNGYFTDSWKLMLQKLIISLYN